ncbi:peptidase G2, partial [Bacillus siamensis]|nr:peptidase G2 [Bacillus siamensis]MED5094744.1 peptidase G2 [Bacillus siamensis]
MNTVLRLKKNYDTTRNSRYEDELSGDMEAIESSVNGIESEITRHKKAEAAHSSEQITHDGFSVSNRLDNLWARFTNLIVNHDGTDVKEVVDSRVGTGAKVYDT